LLRRATLPTEWRPTSKSSLNGGDAGNADHGRDAHATILFRPTQIKRIMHDLQRAVGVFLVDNATDSDLAGGDVLDIDLSVGKSLEHFLGNAGVDFHADVDGDVKMRRL
jgi:hypothetical protein